MSEEIYTAAFYSRISTWSSTTAKILVPLIIEIVKPSSIIDVGCGDGTWLREFELHGVNHVLGLDGNYVMGSLKIDKKNFLSCDLNTPPKIKTKFDLAVSLEVAEHLLESSSANFVEYLTHLSDLILFSAAIPYQTGDNHINLHWQSFWASLFEQRNFLPVTIFRSKIWNNPSIPFFYKQNMILYVNDEIIKNSPMLSVEYYNTKSSPLSVVHPEYYLELQNTIQELKIQNRITCWEKLGFYLQDRIKYIKKYFIK
jgi:hypothetical protein